MSEGRLEKHPLQVARWGGAPRRGAFFIARRSRHEAPKTPGYPRYALIYDPDRVSLPQGDFITTDPWRGRREREPSAFPGSSGLRPSDTRATKNSPLRGASSARLLCPLRICPITWPPGRGARFVATGRGAQPRRPVDQPLQAIPRPRQGVALIDLLVSATPWRGRLP